MKIRKYSGDEERMILTALIVNSTILGKVVAGLPSEKKPFNSKWSNVVFNWCREFYIKYNRAPRGTIQSLFRGYAQRQSDDSAVELIEKFLSTLSDDYRAVSKELNVDYMVDLSSKYFNQVRYTRLKDQLEEALLQKDLEAASTSIGAFHPVSFDASAVVDVFTDEAAWREAIEVKDDEVLIDYPGDLGDFFGPHLQRDGFIAFLAPEKRGKSFWLLDVTWRAIRNKRRTFFVSAGDMSRRQVLQRLGTRAARRPINAGKFTKPKRLSRTDSGEVRVKSSTESCERHISRADWVAAQRRVHTLTAMNDSMLKLLCAPNSTINVSDIERSLDEAIKEGWIPDVVVIDYADILAPEVGAKRDDFRHQTNETWKALRRLSQKYHCLVVTATQSDAASYESKVITRKHFSEDKRKLSHVTGMIGINQTEEEKGKGLYRLNWVALREGIYFETKCVTVAGSLALANPAMKSVW